VLGAKGKSGRWIGRWTATGRWIGSLAQHQAKRCGSVRRRRPPPRDRRPLSIAMLLNPAATAQRSAASAAGDSSTGLSAPRAPAWPKCFRSLWVTTGPSMLCSPRSCVGSTACDAPRSTDGSEAARINVRARVQRFFSPEISHRTRLLLTVGRSRSRVSEYRCRIKFPTSRGGVGCGWHRRYQMVLHPFGDIWQRLGIGCSSLPAP
jgi:hypothetical protein